MMIHWYCFVAVFSLCLMTCTKSATLSEESSSNSVEVTFYQFQTSQWAEKEPAFKTKLVSQVNSYCQMNTASCGLKDGISLSLTSAEFMTVADYPKDVKRDMKLKVYLKFSSTISGNSSYLSSPPITTYVLNKAALSTVFKNSRPALNDVMGSWIVFVDSEQIGYPPLQMINTIMIPIACALLVIVIILACVLYCYQKNVNKKAKRERQLDMKNKKRAGRIGPAPDGENGGHWNGSLGGTEQWYISESGQSNEGHVSKNRGPPAYHTIEVPDVTREGALPPLEDEDGEKKKKDKKKKKHKKHKKHDEEVLEL